MIKPGSQNSADSYILGIFCYFHDSSACLLRNGRIVAMAEEERFNRKKHSYDFPVQAIKYCLKEANISLSQVDYIAYGMLPWKILLNQVYSALTNLPASINLLRKGSSHLSISQKVSGLLSLRSRIAKEFGGPVPKVLNIPHHYAHAYSAFFASPYKESAILVMDGYGETFSTSFYYGKDNDVYFKGYVPYPNSLGIYYGTVTQFLGFKPVYDEYKVMGMCAYGQDRYADFFKKMLVTDGNPGFKLDTSYTSFFSHGLNKWFSQKMARELGGQRDSDTPYEQRHFDIANSAQARLEEVAIHLGKRLRQDTGSLNLCLAGGCAQNVLMNRTLLDNCGFKNVFVPPVAYDAGVSLGAALAVYRKFSGGRRDFILDRADWGPGFSDAECLKAISEKGLKAKSNAQAPAYVAKLIADGKIVGYFDARMEVGPRALGNRSILADPRRADMKEVLNSRIKKREFFRPFAPVVIWEECQKFFDLPIESNFMALTAKVKAPQLIPAVTHNDGTARVQTIKQQINPNMYHLLKEFATIAGVPVLLNTSFNENEPIVCAPEEAIDCFLRTRMDALVFNGSIIVERDSRS